jgi:opacity protein-like surface antigen
MKRSLVFLSTMAILGSLAPQAQAFDWFGGRLSIGGGYGRVKPKLPYDYQDSYQDGAAWSGHLQYFLNNDVSVLASYADLEPYKRGVSADQFHFRPMVASLRYNIFHHLPFTPYITAGAGYSINRHEIPSQVSVKWGGFTYQAGLGAEFFITEGTSIGAEALYHSFEADGNKTPYRLASLMGTMNIHFGPGPSARRTEDALK